MRYEYKLVDTRVPQKDMRDEIDSLRFERWRLVNQITSSGSTVFLVFEREYIAN